MGFIQPIITLNSRWAWIPCYLIMNRVSTNFWFRYDHFTFRCNSFNPFKITFTKEKDGFMANKKIQN